MRRLLALAVLLAVFVSLPLGTIREAEQAVAAPAAVAWAPCYGSFECATLEVPLDYANPGGGTVSLALARLEATDPERRIGALLMNPGGPGGSAIDLLLGRGPRFNAEMRARFDLVAFDPRGVGQSTPIACHDTLQQYIAVD